MLWKEEQLGYLVLIHSRWVKLNRTKVSISNPFYSASITQCHPSTGAVYLDIDPLPGRVLIFEQEGIPHSGEEVTKGVKYSVRTDFMYRVAPPKSIVESVKDGVKDVLHLGGHGGGGGHSKSKSG